MLYQLSYTRELTGGTAGNGGMRSPPAVQLLPPSRRLRRSAAMVGVGFEPT